jgi:hypothetical protein
MGDVTFFIQYHFVDSTREDPMACQDNKHMSHATGDDSKFRLLFVPSKRDDAPIGCIEYYNEITNTYQHIQYRIKVIDIDRKPAKNIRSRAIKERLLDDRVVEHVLQKLIRNHFMKFRALFRYSLPPLPLLIY